MYYIEGPPTKDTFHSFKNIFIIFFFSGDVQYKPYVTSTPDTRCISLDGTEDFLIIATDGVWDFVNTYDAAMIVYVAIREYPGG